MTTIGPTNYLSLEKYLDWGKMAPLRVFAKYLKNCLSDLHETL